MSFFRKMVPTARLSLGLLALGMTAASGTAQSLDAHVAPAITRFGHNLGLESPSARLSLTVWLNPHNRAEFDAKVKDLYTEGSPSYHKWLTGAELKSYMPTDAEASMLEKELAAHNLTVTARTAMNMGVRVTGSVADVERAFNTQISRYSVHNQIVRTTSTEPRLNGPASSLVQGVGGLNSLQARPMLVRPVNPHTRKPLGGIPVSKAGPNGTYFSGQCFYAPTTLSLTGVNAFDGVTPVSEKISGLVYGANPANTALGSLPSCGYSPSEVQGFYGMKTAYGRGYNGAGQTVAIIDIGVNDQAEVDGNIFNRIEGLPKFTDANYKTYMPYAVGLTGADYGADVETDLDVEWAHAMAPGANIALVQINPDNEDFQAAVLYIAQNHLANAISVSYGEPESEAGPLDASLFNYASEVAAATGISVQVSTGDSGDFTADGLPADVNAIASSPYDTAVGGTSIGTNPVDGSVSQTGWGNNLSPFTFGTGYIVDPPTDQGFFYGGSGGGASSIFAKPAYQKKLPGTKRLLPDISALADPFTGAEFVYDDGAGNALVGVVGGTSLASPIIAGMWAVVNQYAGTPLGNAAPYFASAPAAFVTDILPISGPANPTAKVTDPKGTTSYSAVALSEPLATTTSFVSAIWDLDTYGDYYNITFGTDGALTVTPGWDNVTGYGSPNIGALFSVLP